MMTLMSLLGWIALVAFGICIVAIFCTYYAAKNTLRTVVRTSSSPDASLSTEAANALQVGARGRIKWLKGNQSRLSADIKKHALRVLWFDTISQGAFWILLVSGLLSIFLGKSA
jgi:hypothetical protein